MGQESTKEDSPEIQNQCEKNSNQMKNVEQNKNIQHQGNFNPTILVENKKTIEYNEEKKQIKIIMLIWKK